MIPDKESAKRVFADSMDLEVFVDSGEQITFELKNGSLINCWTKNPRYNEDGEYGMDINLHATENRIKTIFEKLKNFDDFKGEVKLSSKKWSENETQLMLIIKMPKTESLIFVGTH